MHQQKNKTFFFMKLKLSITVLILAFSFSTIAQETEPKPKGKVTGKIFFNYHADMTDDVDKGSAFELQRAYLGYKYTINDKFAATVTLDAGKGSAGSDHTVFVKQAKLDYKASDKIILSFGLMGMKQFKDQEKFWGYRYIYKSFADEYKFGTSADLGAMASFKVAKDFKLDVLAVNGEGYKKLQDSDGNHRVGVNLAYTPENWVFKAYFDTMNGTDVDDESTSVNNIAFFAGYKADNFRIGAEYNMLQNGESYKDPAADKDLTGLSFYGTYIINEKWIVFGRYDDLSSNKLSGDSQEWNYSDDGSTIIAGVEYKATKGVDASLNFRTTSFDNSSNNTENLVYLNLQFYF